MQIWKERLKLKRWFIGFAIIWIFGANGEVINYLVGRRSIYDPPLGNLELFLIAFGPAIAALVLGKIYLRFTLPRPKKAEWFEQFGHSWYVLSNTRGELGPLSPDQLCDLIRVDSLAIDTPVRSEKFDGWKFLGDIGVSPNPSQPAIQEVEGSQPDKIQVWRRTFSKLFDMLFVMVAFILGLALTGHSELIPSDKSRYVQLFQTHVFLLGYGFSWLIAECISLSAFGTTLGRFLFNLRIRRADGSRPNVSDYLLRSLGLWVRGFGLFLPYAYLVTVSCAYYDLLQEKIAPWDKSRGLIVTSQPLGLIRWLVLGVTLAGIIFLLTRVR